MSLQVDQPSTWVVLVVDDDDSNRLILETILDFYDATVVEASSGQDALQQIEAHLQAQGTTNTMPNAPHMPPFNVVLLDIQMPEMDGWSVLRAIRAHARTSVSNLPVIAVTAMAMRGDQERVLAAGFDGYMVKPLVPESLIVQIAQILDTIPRALNSSPVVVPINTPTPYPVEE